ncbi:MAG: hypothetical protein SPI65_04120 [Peptoniphilus sp.]|nr:hypothetical protein [Peptoniphilus sp.]MDY6044751.1 hypothetical protein [Peptoniphilus sp.]
MFFYVLVIAFLLYRLIRTRSAALVWLIIFACISAASYLGIINRLDAPIPYIIYGVAILAVVGSIVSSVMELRRAKRDYLKKRRMRREMDDGLSEDDKEGHARIVVQDVEGKEKILYVKRNRSKEAKAASDEKVGEVENVPHGTDEGERTDKTEYEDEEDLDARERLTVRDTDDEEKVSYAEHTSMPRPEELDRDLDRSQDVPRGTNSGETKNETKGEDEEYRENREHIIIRGVDGKEKILYIERDLMEKPSDEEIDDVENVPHGTDDGEDEEK